MKTKSLFTDLEWNLLQMGVLWVFQGIAMADGIIEPREINAIENLSKNAHKFHNELAKDVFGSIDFNREEFANIYNLSPRINVGLHELAIVVNEKLNAEDAISFKKYMLAAGLYVVISSRNEDNGINVGNLESKALNNLAKILLISPVDLARQPKLNDIIRELE